MSDRSQLRKKHPLPDDETWLRNLTNSDHVTRDGTVHMQALKTPALSRPDAIDDVPWACELSGRALSASGNIID